MNTISNWIKARIPVDDTWRQVLQDEIAPFLEAARKTGAVDRWFYAFDFSHGLTIDTFIQADISAVHTVLLPALRDRFSRKLRPAEVPCRDNILQSIRQLTLGREELKEGEDILAFKCLSTELYLQHQQVRRPGLNTVYSEVHAAIAATGWEPNDIIAFAKTCYRKFLNLYMGGRFSIFQINERKEQEAQLTTFLRQQATIHPRPMLQSYRKSWVEQIRSVADDQSLLVECLFNHVERYGLDHYQAGQLWVNVCLNANAFEPASAPKAFAPQHDFIARN